MKKIFKSLVTVPRRTLSEQQMESEETRESVAATGTTENR
jgi:hypothetical protein